MSTLQDDDNLIVQRGNTLFKTEIQNMSTIQDTDLLIVGRGSKSYKITGQEFMDQVNPPDPNEPPSMTGATLSSTGSGFSGESYTTTLQNYDPGNPEATLGLKAKVTGPFSLVGETSAITAVNGNVLTLTDRKDLDNGLFVAGDVVDEASNPTVVSISQSSPEMTVSGGTWNVGETVKNTVARAPVITPTTDEITKYEVTGGDSEFPTADLTATGDFGQISLPSGTDLKSLKLKVQHVGGPSFPQIGFSSTPFTGITHRPEMAGFYSNNTANGIIMVGSPYRVGDSYDVLDKSLRYSDNGAEVDTIADPTLEFVYNNVGQVWVKHQGRMCCTGNGLRDGDPVTGTSPMFYDLSNGHYVGFLSRTSDVTGTINPTENVLTFASDKDLADFNAGDDVEQDSGYTPQTSAITNVVDNTLSGTYEIRSGSKNLDYRNHETAAYNPTVWSSANIIGTATVGVRPNFGGSGRELIYKFNKPEDSVPFVRYAGSLSADYKFAIWGSNDGVNYDYIATSLGITGSGTVGLVSGSTPYQYFVFRQWGSSNQEEASASNNYGIDTIVTPKTTLTLTDDTDLANFRVGDVVGIDAPTDGGGGTPGTGNSIYYVTGVESEYAGYEYKLPKNPGAIVTAPWDSGSRTEGESPYWQNPYRIILDPPVSVNSQIKIKMAGTVYGWLYLNNQKNSRAYASSQRPDQEQTPAPGSSYNNDTITITPDYFEGPAVISQLTVGADKDSASGNFVYGMEIDGTPYYAAIGGPVKVTAIGPGNTLTVDGGTWNNGDTVTGPATQPATGTVASTDPAANTMTLSASDESGTKRWIVNAGKTVVGPTGPAASVSSYLTWDNTNTVNGMTSSDPGYAPVTDLTLTFPNDAPTGQTWDQELPAGTYIETRVEATNTEGTADSGWSNSVTPRFMPVDANSDESYAETALRQLTFENRKHVYCAQQVEAQRDQAIQALAAEGYELSEILKYL